MRSVDIKEGGIYAVNAWKYRDEKRYGRAYVEVLCGPLPARTRGHYEFEVRFLNGPFYRQIRRLAPAVLSYDCSHDPDAWMTIEKFKTSQELTVRADAAHETLDLDVADRHVRVRLSDTEDQVEIQLSAEATNLLPEIMQVINTKLRAHL